MSSQPLRAGLVGAGYISEFHASALQHLRGVDIAGICDVNLSRAQAIAARFGIPGAYTSLKEMAAATHLDVVHVLTPPAHHTAVTLEALELGLHVFVEKPLAENVEDCDRIAEAAKRAGKAVGVNHSLLRDPFVMRALDIARSGALGDIMTVDYFRSSDYAPWAGGPVPPQYRDGGYPFRDLGVHALYTIAAFLGPIEDVAAWFGTKGGDPNLLYDEWRATVRCQKGTGQFQLSWSVKPLESLLVVRGTKGTMRADLFSMAVTTRRSSPMPKAIERAWNPIREGLSAAVQVPANVLRFLRKRILPYQGLRTMVAEFYAALEAGHPAPVTPEDARPIVDWTERIARQGDEAKRAFLNTFPKTLTAKVLVTGTSGFLGGRLLARLLASLPANEKLRVLVRRPPKPAIAGDGRLEIVYGDMGDAAAMDRAVSGVEMIYHVGGAMSGSAADYQRGTSVATRNLIAGIEKQATPPKLVYISSLSVLHWEAARADAPIREDFPLEPSPELRGAYTQGKLDAERQVLQAARERGLQAVILRPGQIFGPGAPLITGAVARRAGGRYIILGNGRLVLPLVHVDDVVDAILLAVRRNRWDGEVFHIVDSADVTQESLLKRVEPGVPVTRIPRVIVNVLALGLEMLGAILKRPPPLSRYRVASALAPVRFDCSEARQQLGWMPSVGVEAGILRYINRS